MLAQGGRTTCAPSPVQAQSLTRRFAGKAHPEPASSNMQPRAAEYAAGRRRRCSMDRHLVMLRVTVKDGERALLVRNGRFERVLEPGRHWLLDLKRELAVEVHQIVRAEFPADRYAVLKSARRAARSRRGIVRGGGDEGR
jgi:hypothetical protein